MDNKNLRLLTEKFNIRYKALLNEEQIKIIRTYVFSMKD